MNLEVVIDQVYDGKNYFLITQTRVESNCFIWVKILRLFDGKQLNQTQNLLSICIVKNLFFFFFFKPFYVILITVSLSSLGNLFFGVHVHTKKNHKKITPKSAFAHHPDIDHRQGAGWLLDKHRKIQTTGRMTLNKWIKYCTITPTCACIILNW